MNHVGKQSGSWMASRRPHGWSLPQDVRTSELRVARVEPGSELDRVLLGLGRRCRARRRFRAIAVLPRLRLFPHRSSTTSSYVRHVERMVAATAMVSIPRLWRQAERQATVRLARRSHALRGRRRRECRDSAAEAFGDRPAGCPPGGTSRDDLGLGLVRTPWLAADKEEVPGSSRLAHFRWIAHYASPATRQR